MELAIRCLGRGCDLGLLEAKRGLIEGCGCGCGDLELSILVPALEFLEGLMEDLRLEEVTLSLVMESISPIMSNH